MNEKELIDYVRNEAENHGVPFVYAMAIFNVLGESEMYDGFISSLEDASREVFQDHEF